MIFYSEEEEEEEEESEEEEEEEEEEEGTGEVSIFEISLRFLSLFADKVNSERNLFLHSFFSGKLSFKFNGSKCRKKNQVF